MPTGCAPTSIRSISCLRARRMRHIKELIVGGRTVTRDGEVSASTLASMNEDLLARFRSGIAQNAALAAALPHLERAVRDHFETPCC